MTYLMKIKALPPVELQAHLRRLVNLNPACPFESGPAETVIVNGLIKMRSVGKANAQKLYEKAKSA